MQKEFVKKSEIKLIGLSARTNNNNEMNPKTAKIAGLVQNFFGKNIAAQIPHRKNPGTTLMVYTEYESNEYGHYTYFIGEEVDSFENISHEWQKLTIPAAHYQKFTTRPGSMPEVVIDAWQQIWKMSPGELGGQRTYQADFEVYDERASNPVSISLDIYIGVK